MKINMPPLRFGYIVDLAREVGLYQKSWPDIHAWQSLTGIVVTKFEAVMIHELLDSYTSAVSQFHGSDAPRPWVGGYIDREAVGNSIRATLRGR